MNKKAVIVMIIGCALVAVAVLSYLFMTTHRSSDPAGAAAAAFPAKKAMTPQQEETAIKSAALTLSESPDSPKAEAAYLSLGAVYENRGEFEKSKEVYRKLIEKFPASKNVQGAQEAIDAVNVKTLFLSTATPGSTVYQVKKGDNLTKIARKFKTTTELVIKANGLASPALHVGQKLKVTTLKFSVVIDKSQNILMLKADEGIFKTYRVSTGKESSPTPVGTFTVTNKIIDPPWYPAGKKMIPSSDPRNVLGSRWLGLSKPSYGIHGTTDPASIGKSVTDGCVRLKNSDVEELYSIVPEGTEVVIVD